MEYRALLPLLSIIISGAEMFSFTPFPKITVKKDKTALNRFLEDAGKEGRRIMEAGMRAQSRISQPGEWPYRRTGNLYRTINYQVGVNQVTVGTNMYYSPFLAYGTRKMAARKMSKEALQEAITKITRKNYPFIAFSTSAE